jgi:hypothetical protein
MFGNIGAAIGGMFGKQKQPQGIGPSPEAMQGMAQSPVPSPPMTAQAPEAMQQAPMMMNQQPQQMGGIGPSMGAMGGMMQKPPQSPMGIGGPASNTMPVSRGPQQSQSMFRSSMIQGPQQQQSMVRPGMAGSSYGHYRGSRW